MQLSSQNLTLLRIQWNSSIPVLRKSSETLIALEWQEYQQFPSQHGWLNTWKHAYVCDPSHQRMQTKHYANLSGCLGAIVITKWFTTAHWCIFLWNAWLVLVNEELADMWCHTWRQGVWVPGKRAKTRTVAATSEGGQGSHGGKVLMWAGPTHWLTGRKTTVSWPWLTGQSQEPREPGKD